MSTVNQQIINFVSQRMTHIDYTPEHVTLELNLPEDIFHLKDFE